MSEISNPDIVSLKNDEQTGGGSSKPVEDIEVKDAQMIFDSVWHELSKFSFVPSQAIGSMTGWLFPGLILIRV